MRQNEFEKGDVIGGFCSFDIAIGLEASAKFSPNRRGSRRKTKANAD